MRFRAFGGIRIDEGVINRPQSAQLLALLLAHHGRPVSPSDLEEALWGEQFSPPGLLHTAVSRLRSLLKPLELVRQPAGYVLNIDPLSFDVEVFTKKVNLGTEQLAIGNQAVAVSHLADALHTWTAPPFAGVDSIHQIGAEVRRLTAMHASAAMQLGDALLALNRPNDALATATSTIHDHPFHEGLRLVHARALAATGQRVAALRALHSFSRLLAEETGLVPTKDLQSLEYELAAHAPSPQQQPTDLFQPPPTYVVAPGSRQAERERIQQLLNEFVGSGGTKAVLIEGDAGIGKSWLARYLTDSATRRGIAVIRGGCSVGVKTPLLAWSALLRSWPDRRSENSEVDPVSVVVRAVDAAAREGPLVIVIEDAHWADDASLNAFAGVVMSQIGSTQRLSDSSSGTGTAVRLLLVMTARPLFLHRRSETIERLVRDQAVEFLAVGPLSQLDTATLITDLIDARPSLPLLAAIDAVCHGNPLLIEVTVEHMQRSEQFVQSNDGVTLKGVVPLATPSDLVAPYVSVIESLEPVVREILQVIALLGGPVQLADLQTVFGADAVDVVAALVVLETCHLIDWVDGRLQLCHELIRRSVIVSMGDIERQVMHRRIATTLSGELSPARQVDAGRVLLLADQWERAGVLGDPTISAGWSHQAGVVAFRSRLWSDAANHLTAAAARNPQHADPLLLGQAKYLALDPTARESFETAFASALERGDDEQLLDAALGWHRQSLNLGEDRIAPSKRVEELLAGPLRNHRIARIRLRMQMAEFAAETNSSLEALHWLAEAEELALANDPVEWKFQRAFAEGLIQWDLLEFSSAHVAFVRAIEFDHAHSLGSAKVRLAGVALAQGNFELALILTGPEEEQRLRSRQFWFELSLLMSCRAAALALAGDLGGAVSTVGLAIRWARLSGAVLGEVQAVTVGTFLMRFGGPDERDALGTLLDPGQTRPVLLRALWSPPTPPVLENVERKVRRFMSRSGTTPAIRGTQLETLGVMLEWALFELAVPEISEWALGVLDDCDRLEVGSFVGWPTSPTVLRARWLNK